VTTYAYAADDQRLAMTFTYTCAGPTSRLASVIYPKARVGVDQLGRRVIVAGIDATDVGFTGHDAHRPRGVLLTPEPLSATLDLF
jgi:hypothetical protein